MQVVNADSLLERHSINELQSILTMLRLVYLNRAEADKKQYDLRRLVGESYRDVVGAADAIIEMKNEAKLLIKCISESQQLCNEKQEFTLIDQVYASEKGTGI